MITLDDPMVLDRLLRRARPANLQLDIELVKPEPPEMIGGYSTDQTILRFAAVASEVHDYSLAGVAVKLADKERNRVRLRHSPLAPDGLVFAVDLPGYKELLMFKPKPHVRPYRLRLAVPRFELSQGGDYCGEIANLDMDSKTPFGDLRSFFD